MIGFQPVPDLIEIAGERTLRNMELRSEIIGFQRLFRIQQFAENASTPFLLGVFLRNGFHFQQFEDQLLVFNTLVQNQPDTRLADKMKIILCHPLFNVRNLAQDCAGTDAHHFGNHGNCHRAGGSKLCQNLNNRLLARCQLYMRILISLLPWG